MLRNVLSRVSSLESLVEKCLVSLASSGYKSESSTCPSQPVPASKPMFSMRPLLMYRTCSMLRRTYSTHRLMHVNCVDRGFTIQERKKERKRKRKRKKNRMQITCLFSKGSFEKRHELWASTIPICILMTNNALQHTATRHCNTPQQYDSTHCNNAQQHTATKQCDTHRSNTIQHAATMHCHVTYERVMSHMRESCHIWESHVTHCNNALRHPATRHCDTLQQDTATYYKHTIQHTATMHCNTLQHTATRHSTIPICLPMTISGLVLLGAGETSRDDLLPWSYTCTHLQTTYYHGHISMVTCLFFTRVYHNMRWLRVVSSLNT